MARPFLKAVGGKTQLLPELLKHVPPTFGTYYEPFVGGGALFFELQSLGLLKHGAVLSDANAELINAYVAVRDHVSDVILELCVHRDAHSEERYLWRVNKSGECNVPWGKHKSYEPDEENLRACSAALQGVELKCVDYAEALRVAKRGDLAYCDPPYFPAGKTANFTGYTKGGFGADEQRRLASVLALCACDGVRVIASNADVPECRELYTSAAIFDIHEVQARRAVNCKGTKRGKVGELIITGGAR